MFVHIYARVYIEHEFTLNVKQPMPANSREQRSYSAAHLRNISATFNFLSLASPQHRPRFHNSIQVSMLKWLVRISYFPITSFKSIGKLAERRVAMPPAFPSPTLDFCFGSFVIARRFRLPFPLAALQIMIALRNIFSSICFSVGGDLIFFSISLFLSYF